MFAYARRHSFSCAKILKACFVSVLGIGRFTEGKTQLLPQEDYILIESIAMQWNYILSSIGNIKVLLYCNWKGGLKDFL